jgi:hypothetical protein
VVCSRDRLFVRDRLFEKNPRIKVRGDSTARNALRLRQMQLGEGVGVRPIASLMHRRKELRHSNHLVRDARRAGGTVRPSALAVLTRLLAGRLL